MQVHIVGDGAFGSFLKELLSPHFEISTAADSVILAVPISAYETVAADNAEKHIINVCSVQRPSTEHILRYTENVTCIHPLFGARTPENKRNSVVSRTISESGPAGSRFVANEKAFLDGFANVSSLMYEDHKGERFTPDSHDRLMARTHAAAVLAAKQMKVFVDRAEDIPDELLPNSFRLMRDFVKTLDDMPQGTIESIMANPYF